MINPIRGTKDIAFEDAKKFKYFIDTATKVVENYDYNYIDTPKFEETSLYCRSVGESSDIVNKEMYSFCDNGGRNITLRPEGTAGVARFFISNKLDRQQGAKYKFYYYGAMFRQERPQKGRYREFNQFGCESFGEASVYEDYTTIEVISKIFDKLNIKYSLIINSLGCNECMPKYKESLVNYLNSKKDKLCEDCNRRIEQNPIRVLDCKIESCQKELIDAPKITKSLCSSCDKDFKKLKELLDSSNIEYIVDDKLVRGLDYYNKTAFEFISKEIGSQGSIAGGGRYDGLIESLDAKPTPAVGFGIGIERVMMLIELPKDEPNGYYLGAMDELAIEKILKISNKIRDKQKAIVEYSPKKLRNHLKVADKSNVKYCAVIGEDELRNNTIWVKNLVTKEENTPTIDEFLKNIK